MLSALHTIREERYLMDYQYIQHICEKFKIGGTLTDCVLINTGHINKTYRADFTMPDGTIQRFTVQAINTYVFPDPKAIMDNISGITEHIRRKVIEEGGDPQREAMHFLQTDTGEYFHWESDKTVWRIYHYIDHTSTYNKATDLQMIYNAGIGFGKFQRRLADYPMEKLNITIADFHNTPKRLMNLWDAAQKDTEGRSYRVQEELQFFKEHEKLFSRLQILADTGKIPLRVTHNDTKYNNILIDDNTAEAVCVIDLDTVMPGLSAYDYGDAIRFAAASCNEDETDLDLVYMKKGNFESFTAGFLGECRGFFSDEELDTMALGAVTITAEIASRFLEDYLRGDKYFRIGRDEQNLDRARCQIKLAKSMLDNFEYMQKTIDQYKISAS